MASIFYLVNLLNKKIGNNVNTADIDIVIIPNVLSTYFNNTIPKNIALENNVRKKHNNVNLKFDVTECDFCNELFPINISYFVTKYIIKATIAASNIKDKYITKLKYIFLVL